MEATLTLLVLLSLYLIHTWLFLKRILRKGDPSPSRQMFRWFGSQSAWWRVPASDPPGGASRHGPSGRSAA
jgi:hypothetical protein